MKIVRTLIVMTRRAKFGEAMEEIVIATGPSGRTGVEAKGARAIEIYLSRILGVSTRVRVARSYERLGDLLRTQSADFGWLPPAVFVRTESQYGVRVLLATVRNEQASFSSALFCEATSEFKELADLCGSRAVWVSPGSCSGYLYPRLLLRDAGLDPSQLFAEQRFVDSHQAVIEEVVSGRADIGATYLRGAPERPRAADLGGDESRNAGLRILGHRGGIPSDAICAAPKVPEALAKKFEEALLGLPEAEGGAAILGELFDAQAFAPISSEAYMDVRRALAVEEAGSVI